MTRKTGLTWDNSIQALFEETEALLEKWKHPDPYRPPTAPGGPVVLFLTAGSILTLLRIEVRAKHASAYS
jgi:hypothetical protein